MSAAIASETSYSEATIELYRRKVAPIPSRTGWDTISDILNGKYAYMLTFFLAGMAYATLYVFSENSLVSPPGIAIFVAILGCIITHATLGSIALKRTVKKPEWSILPLWDLLDLWDCILPQGDPLRAAVASERMRNPEAEFKVEVLKSEIMVDMPTEKFFLWVYESPFCDFKKRPLIVYS